MEGVNLAFELGLSSIYFLIFTTGAIIYTANKPGIEYQFFRYGLIVKMLGGYAFGLLYLFYYGYGDTFTYFESARILSDIIIEDPIYGLKLTFGIQDYIRAKDLLYNHLIVNYYSGNDTFLVIKTTALISLFAFKSFFATTLFFCLFAFYGQWKLYQTFIDRYPNLKLEIGLAQFFIPSVLFWGGGILKDSLMLGFLGILIYQLNLISRYKGNKFKSFFIILICTYFIYIIKSYIILALAPAVLIWVFFSINYKIRNIVIRIFILPFVFISVVSLTLYGYLVLSDLDTRFSQENLISQIISYQTNHHTEIEREGTQSGYTLGSFDGTLTGMIRQGLPAIGTTFFRPFVWEVRNSVMALACFESSIFIILTFVAFFKMKFRAFYALLTNDAFLTMVITFTFLFAFIVGFSAYNFGALVRYKILCLPLFSSFLIILIYSKSTAAYKIS